MNQNNNGDALLAGGITRDCIESAYCFIHQKLRVFEFSTNPTQRDDIEYAIAQYVEGMNPQLYLLLRTLILFPLVFHNSYGKLNYRLHLHRIQQNIIYHNNTH